MSNTKFSSEYLQNSQFFSKAGYSTWLYIQPLRTLFDCGENITTTLYNKAFGIENIFLTHGHWDHIGGLPGLIHIRLWSKGDTKNQFVSIILQQIKDVWILKNLSKKQFQNPKT